MVQRLCIWFIKRLYFVLAVHFLTPRGLRGVRNGRGNLIGHTEKLRALGAKTTAQPPALLAGAGQDDEEEGSPAGQP